MPDGATWALIVVALITAAPPTLAALLNHRKIGRVETKVDERGDEVKVDLRALERKSDAVHDQVRTSNGRTLAQVAEDTVEDVDELRGDVMELAIQFAKHMNDDHTHAMVQRMRQARRDRTETARTIREIQEGDERAERRRTAERRDHERGDSQ